jgi:hypothetical protein
MRRSGRKRGAVEIKYAERGGSYRKEDEKQQEDALEDAKHLGIASVQGNHVS